MVCGVPWWGREESQQKSRDTVGIGAKTLTNLACIGGEKGRQEQSPACPT